MNFNKFQKDAISAIFGNIALIASAGSGKSSVLTHRTVNMIDSGIDSNDILCITFSKSATVNMQKKIKKMMPSVKMPTICTCHALGLSIVKQFAMADMNNGLMSDYEQKMLLIDICVKQLGLFKDGAEVPIAILKNFFDRQKINLKGPDAEVEFDSMGGLEAEYYRRIYRIYEEQKRNRRKIDFTDMLYKAYILLRDNEDIRHFYQDKYKFVLVDEAQDCNLLQIELIRLINMENVFFVGDFFQSIYGFTGCSPSFIINFKDYFPDAKYLNLPINYRCSKNIVENSNRLLHNTEEVSHESFLEPSANKDYYKDPVLINHDDTKAEARDIGNRILEFIKNGHYEYKDIAILMRINAQSAIIQNVFVDMYIPFEIIGGDNFYNRKEIRDMINFLKFICNDDCDAFREIYNVPSRYLGKVFLENIFDLKIEEDVSMLTALKSFERICSWRFRRGVTELLDIVKRVKRTIAGANSIKVSDIFNCILEETNYEEYLLKEFDDEGRMENIRTLIDQAKSFSDVDKFLQSIDKAMDLAEKQKQKKESEEEENSVKVMTVHKSKGLEYPVVFVVSMNEGLFPHKKSDLAEERRLAYVAVTRPEKELYVSFTNVYNDCLSEPSCFIYEMFGEDAVRNVGTSNPDSSQTDVKSMSNLSQIKEDIKSLLVSKEVVEEVTENVCECLDSDDGFFDDVAEGFGEIIEAFAELFE